MPFPNPLSATTLPVDNNNGSSIVRALQAIFDAFPVTATAQSQTIFASEANITDATTILDIGIAAFIAGSTRYSISYGGVFIDGGGGVIASANVTKW